MEAPLVVIRAASFGGGAQDTSTRLSLRILTRHIVSSLGLLGGGEKSVLVLYPPSPYSGWESARVIAEELGVKFRATKTPLPREDIPEILEEQLEVFWREVRRKSRRYRVVFVVAVGAIERIAAKCINENTGSKRKSFPTLNPGGALIVRRGEATRI